MKKYLFLFVFFFGGFGCECFESTPFWNIEDFRIEIENTVSDPDQPVVIVENDTFVMTVYLDTELVSDNFDLNFLTNQLYATSCAEDGLKGMRDTIVGLDIKCLNDFAGIEKGESLNDLFSAGHIVSDGNMTSVSNFIAGSKDWELSRSTNWIFMTTVVPEIGIEYSFTIECEMESGEVLKNTTGRIKWI